MPIGIARRLLHLLVVSLFGVLFVWGNVSLGIAQSPTTTISHSFGTPTIVVGEVTSLTFKIAALGEVTGVGFSTSLPSGLIIASPNGFTGFAPHSACAGAVVTAAPGSANIVLSGAMLGGPSPDNCTLSVNVTAVNVGSAHSIVTIRSNEGADDNSKAAITIDQASTTTTLSSPTSVSKFAESVTLNATVRVEPPGAGLPTGSVVFLEGLVELGTATLSHDGVATLSGSNLAVGGHTITATYKGDGNFKSSSSLPLEQAVSKAATSTVLMSSIGGSTFGQSIILLATVRGSGALPKVSVRFRNGRDTIGIVTLSAEGTARLATSELGVGSHTIIAEYEGDIRHEASTSLPVMVVVEKASTRTSIAVSSDQITAGEPVTLTAKVEGQHGPAQGTVVFKSGVAILGSAPISRGGRSSLTLAGLPLGSHFLVAEYESNADFLQSVSTPLAIVVQSAPPSRDNLHSAALLLLTIVVVGLLFVLRRFLFRNIGRLFKGIWALVRRAVRILSVVRLFRRLGFISRVPARVKPSVAAEVAVGVGVGAIARAFAGGTELDEAFHRTKFDKNQVHLHPHKQLFCSWINPLTPEEERAHLERAKEDERETAGEREEEAEIQDAGEEVDEDLATDQERDRDDAIADLESAKHFSRMSVPLKSNPLNLWDDIEAAYIVELFKGRDNVCFYVLSEFKKTITTNVLMLVIFFSAVLSSVLVLNVLASTYFDLNDILRLTRDLPVSIDLTIVQFEITRDFFNKFIFGAISCLVGSFLMWLFHYAEYRVCQAKNGDLMNAFLINYLARINDTYKHDRNEATKTIIEGKDVARMQEDAILWIINTQSLALRTLFIELFLRNTLFQIRRNSGYYLLFVPPLTGC